ncbi:MAG: hypothetical protein FWD18_04790 [Micrococcales bacterium]|nr:hypothetical protein [Micrococcales bacterium]
MRRLVALAGAALLLAGCGLSDGTDTASPLTGAQTADLSDLSSCLVGTWDLDVAFMEGALLDATQASMQREGLDGTIMSLMFSAVQTTTFTPDGMFSTSLPLSTDMTMSAMGHNIPVTYDATSTGTGTWTADVDTFFTTTESSDIEQLMTMGGEPLGDLLDALILLPDTPTPVVCDASTLTVPFDTYGTNPHLPESLVFTRQG